MQPLPFSLDMNQVQESIHRPGWYVLGRVPGGPWLVLERRDRYEHIMSAWANTFQVIPERLLVLVGQPGGPQVIDHSTP